MRIDTTLVHTGTIWQASFGTPKDLVGVQKLGESGSLAARNGLLLPSTSSGPRKWMAYDGFMFAKKMDANDGKLRYQ